MLDHQTRTVYFFLLLFFTALGVKGQSSYRLQGTVKDKQEPLIGATIYIDAINNGVITNEKGQYEIELKEGSYSLKFPTSAIPINIRL